MKKYNKSQALKISDYLKVAENALEFNYPDIGRFMVTIISAAPFPEHDFNLFKENFSFMDGVSKGLAKYTGTSFRIIAISELINKGNATIRNPYFFDIDHLMKKGINELSFPESILEN